MGEIPLNTREGPLAQECHTWGLKSRLWNLVIEDVWHGWREEREAVIEKLLGMDPLGGQHGFVCKVLKRQSHREFWCSDER